MLSGDIMHSSADGDFEESFDKLHNGESGTGLFDFWYTVSIR